jgi:hypothetical protein
VHAGARRIELVTARAAFALLALLAAALLVGCYGSTEPATDIGVDTAKLHAWGDTERSATTSWFQFSPSNIAGVGTTPERNWPAGVRGPLTESVTGLTPATVYSYRLCGITTGRSVVCAQTRTFRTLDGDYVKANLLPPGGGDYSRLFAVSGPHGEAPHGFLAFPPEVDPPESEDVVCVSVHGDEAVIGTRSAGSSNVRLIGLRAGINPVTMDTSRDPSACASLRPSDLPASNSQGNAQIHDGS